MTRPFLKAEWRHLAMLNFEVDPKILMTYLPRGAELDDRGGRHYVSLVGFLFLDTRVIGIPAFFHQKFEEVNLRFYVRRTVGKETRSGVVFIKEMVPLPFVAEAARLTYNEPYSTVPIQHSILEAEGELETVEYIFGEQSQLCRLAVHASGPAQESSPGSDEEFFCERGWGYTRQRDGGTIEYRVTHPRWRVWPDTRWELEGPLEAFFEDPFPDILSRGPVSALIAEGSAIEVHMPERIA